MARRALLARLVRARQELRPRPSPARAGGIRPASASSGGGSAGPASRSSMRGCGSSRPRAGCTTGPEWSPRASSSSISTSTGGQAKPGSRSVSSTTTRPQNEGNWKWVAGTGIDARPWFRIFNPERRRERFDVDGEYCRRWLPEWVTSDYPESMLDLAAEAAGAKERFRAASR